MTEPIYLDYNATCPLDDEVQEEIKSALANLWENPSSSRGGGKACQAAIERARQLLADMINASPEEITFTSGGTETNNLVIYSMLEEYQRYLSKQRSTIKNSSIDIIPNIITTNIEHPSICQILNNLEANNLCSVSRIPASTETGAISASEVAAAVLPNTCLVTVMWANNETGVLQPLDEVSKLIKELNAVRLTDELPVVRLHTDAAQAIGKVAVDVNYGGGGIDYLTIVGHKFYGPRIGALFIRAGVQFYPTIFGGGQERGIRPGTENTPMIVGLGKAAELVVKNLDNYTSAMKLIRDYFEMQLRETFKDDVQIHFAHVDRLPNTSSVSFKCIPGTAAELLSHCSRLIASTGAACHSETTTPSAVLTACGVSEQLALRTVRFSFGRCTNKSDIDDALNDLRKAIETVQIGTRIC